MVLQIICVPSTFYLKKLAAISELDRLWLDAQRENVEFVKYLKEVMKTQRSRKASRLFFFFSHNFIAIGRRIFDRVDSMNRKELTMWKRHGDVSAVIR